jgi:hypothetical protein
MLLPHRYEQLIKIQYTQRRVTRSVPVAGPGKKPTRRLWALTSGLSATHFAVLSGETRRFNIWVGTRR